MSSSYGGMRGAIVSSSRAQHVWLNPLHYPDRNGPCGLREEQCSMVELFLLKDSEQTHPSGSYDLSGTYQGI